VRETGAFGPPFFVWSGRQRFGAFVGGVASRRGTTVFRPDRHKTVHETGLALDQHELPDQVGELHAPVAGYLLYRPIEPGGDLQHQGGLAGTRGAGQQQAVPRRIGEEGQDVA